MLKDMSRAYAGSSRFVGAMPWVAGMIVAAEAAQHAVEWQIGMYDSLAAAVAVEAHPLRMGFGYAKTAVLFVACYWVWRYLAFGEDAGRARRFDPSAAALFVRVLLFNAAMMFAHDRGGSLLSALVPEGRPLLLAGLAGMLAATALELFFSPWKVASAAGNARLTMGASFAIMRGNIGWSFGFTLAMMLPLMALHYLLGGLAIGAPKAVALALLGLDCLVVGYLGVVLPAAEFVLARRAAERSAVDLGGGGAARPAAR